MMKLNQDRFVTLLKKMVAFGPRLQNAPSSELIPEEILVAELVEEILEPHVASGFLTVERLSGPEKPKRPNLVITVPGTGSGTIGLVGAHFDVVPAFREAEGWERDPFTLWVGDDGTLYGRGVTDCLGHIAVLTDLLAQLGEAGVRPKRTVKVVMISNEEEAPLADCGLDYVVDNGHMEDLRGGPVYWLDSADFGPTVGTGGICMWRLHVTGFAGHSGMVQNCVNALELAMASGLHLAEKFKERFPPHPEEERYGFLSSSSLKSTVVRADNEKVTKVPGEVTIEGDFRLTPFYSLDDAVEFVKKTVSSLNAAIQKGEPPPGFPRVKTVGGDVGELRWEQNGRNMGGVACDLESEGLLALEQAMAKVRGKDSVQRFSITGSLPLIRDLQKRGFDLQITGFGRSTYYHAPNEQANLEHFEQGFSILSELLDILE